MAWEEGADRELHGKGKCASDQSGNNTRSLTLTRKNRKLRRLDTEIERERRVMSVSCICMN